MKVDTTLTNAYQDTALTASTSYEYEVTAVIVTDTNAIVESDKSDPLTATTIA